MSRPVRVSVQIPANYNPDYKVIRERVRRAEDTGVDVVFGYDHFLVPQVSGVGPEGIVLEAEQWDLPNFEPLSALAAWAEQTSRVELGLLVTGIAYRNPDLLADIARTIDHISGGRHILGLGSGWYEPDYKEYGFEFGTTGEKLKALEAGLERITARLEKLNPKPLTRKPPAGGGGRTLPILLAASGEKKALRLVAKYADIWHSFGDVPTLERRKAVLAEHAQAVGRDVNEIEIAQEWPGFDKVDAYLDAGVTFFNAAGFEVFNRQAFDPDDDFSWLKEIIAWRDRTNS